MADLTDTTKVSSGTGVYYDRVTLARAMPYQIHAIPAQRRPLKDKQSAQIKFRRYTNLTTATTPLTEGISPDGSALSVTDITATAQQYGKAA